MIRYSELIQESVIKKWQKTGLLGKLPEYKKEACANFLENQLVFNETQKELPTYFKRFSIPVARRIAGMLEFNCKLLNPNELIKELNQWFDTKIKWQEPSQPEKGTELCEELSLTLATYINEHNQATNIFKQNKPITILALGYNTKTNSILVYNY